MPTSLRDIIATSHYRAKLSKCGSLTSAKIAAADVCDGPTTFKMEDDGTIRMAEPTEFDGSEFIKRSL